MDTASLSRLTTTALRVSHWIESASAGKVTPLTLDVSGRGVSLLLRGDADAFVAAIGTLHGSTAAEDLVWRAELATITVEWHVICADLSMDGVRIGFSIGSSSAPAWLLARCPRPAEQVAA